MAAKSARLPLLTSLRSSILAITLIGFAIIAAPAWWGFNTLVNATIVQLGTLFAEKQILFDRYRGLGALMQEVTLAETLTRSPVMTALIHSVMAWKISTLRSPQGRSGPGTVPQSAEISSCVAHSYWK